MSTRRLFIGLALDEEVARRLARRTDPYLRDAQGTPLPGHRLHDREDLHLTLAFLGEQPAGVVQRLAAVLTEEIRGMQAPELRLAGTGAFPDLDQPRVLWARVEDSDPSGGRLWALRNRAWQAALSVGWRPGRVELTRPFTPHVTLARLRGAAPDPEFGGLLFEQGWLPTDVQVYESLGGDREPRYRPLAAVPLVVQPG